MLRTTATHDFELNIVDTTVIINPGIARIGNRQINFPGGMSTFDRLYSFNGDASTYQNVLLYLQSVDGLTADMTRAVSDTTALAALTIPEMPTDTTFNSYAPGFPVKVFTFFSADGATGTLYP